VDGDQVYSAVDGKPKSTRQLRRLANIAARAGVSMLADHYDEDWNQLWWVRADGSAAIVTDQTAMAGPLRLLAARYPQYQDDPPAGPVIVITVQRWTGWTAAP
jgi:PPOX class probable F420-dependent enzyme